MFATNNAIAFKILILSILFNCGFYVSESNAQNNIEYSFYVAGHTYGNTKIGNTGLHDPFQQKFSYIKSRSEIKFGILTGDIVKPHPTDKEWDDVEADIGVLDLPVYFAVGNHDMENRELFEERYGETYYSFNYENDLFVVLDPNLDEWNISGDQLLFLTNTLAENEKLIDHLFVFFHQVLWWEENTVYTPYRPNSFAGKADSINFWTELVPLFSAYSKPVYLFAGDFGAANWSADFLYDKFGNISMVASGMGEEIGDNFVIVNVLADNSIDYDLICLNDEDLECFGELTDYRLTTNSDPFENVLQKVKVYPNPASDEIIVEILSHETSNCVLSIYNTTGFSVLTKSVSSFKNKIQLNLDDGIYIYTIIDEKGLLETGKLIIID